ncbi:MAG: clan AA aspartic protease [Prochloron sp. SP5CPC1]|nr:clan AA aspartic protease [Candidatus Paraprochloron terpiosi SP5CPC1]
MITGVVNSYLEPTTRLQLKGSKGQIQEVEAVIDTGFNGFLTLPPTLIQTLQLTPIGSGRTILGNGTQDLYLIYEATVLWDQRWLIVEADGANTDILIGMGLLSGYNLHVEVVRGGRVSLDSFRVN